MPDFQFTPIWAFARICEGAIDLQSNCIILAIARRDFRLRAGDAGANRAPHPMAWASLAKAFDVSSGRSSGVEHNLAKVGVESSNLFARSSFSMNLSMGRSAVQSDNLANRPAPNYTLRRVEL